MENRNDRKSYYKGLLTGGILCVLMIGVLALSGCFTKTSAASSGSQTTGTGDAVEASGSGSSDDMTDISNRYSEIEQKLNKLHAIWMFQMIQISLRMIWRKVFTKAMWMH